VNSSPLRCPQGLLVVCLSLGAWTFPRLVSSLWSPSSEHGHRQEVSRGAVIGYVFPPNMDTPIRIFGTSLDHPPSMACRSKLIAVLLSTFGVQIQPWGLIGFLEGLTRFDVSSHGKSGLATKPPDEQQILGVRPALQEEESTRIAIGSRVPRRRPSKVPCTGQTGLRRRKGEGTRELDYRAWTMSIASRGTGGLTTNFIYRGSSKKKN